VRPILILVMMMPGGLVSTGTGVEGTQQTEVGLHRDFSNEDPDGLQGFQRTAQWLGNQLHSAGGLADAQPAPCVSSSPQFTLNRYKSEGATSMMRAKSGQSLQTHSGIAQPGLQVRERVKERAGACIRRGKRERLEGCRRRNASVGRSDCVQRANGEDHTSDGGGPAG